MIVTAEVTQERLDAYTSAKGVHVQNAVLVVVDKEQPAEARFSSALEYTMTADEKAKYSGKLIDKKIKLGINKLQAWGNVLRISGAILSEVKA